MNFGLKREVRNIQVEMEPSADGEESPVLVFDLYEGDQCIGKAARIRTGGIFAMMHEHLGTDMHKINKMVAEHLTEEGI